MKSPGSAANPAVLTVDPAMRLDGRVAAVTGGGRGIGAATARLLAQLGAHVVVIDNGVDVDGSNSNPAVAKQVSAEIAEQGYSAQAASIDASDYQAVGDLFAQIAADHGHVDLVVTAAGTLRTGPIWEMSVDDWESVMRSHVTHTFAAAQHACRMWRDQWNSGDTRGGRLINMTAATGLVGRPDMGANHAAAKGAIAALTLELAHEMFAYRVTVNAVCAANVRGRMAEHVKAQIPAAVDGFDPGDPVHSANVIGYLCSAEGAWITGQVLRVIGGLVGWYQPWHVAGSISQDQAWTMEDLRLGLHRLLGVYPEFQAIQTEHRQL